MQRYGWLVILLVVAAVAFVAAYAWLVVDLPSLETLPDRLAVPSSRILDRNGRLLYEVIDPNGGGHTVVPISQIPVACQNATIAVEDANYYQHPGVDLVGIIRAAYINLQGGETLAGGSTITQQVARHLLLGPQSWADRTLTRKLRESILAWRLARAYSKLEVLELYLNQTFYGNLAYGIDAAARNYFGQSVAELDLAQCALLAGLPQAPAIFDPLTDPDATRTKQALVLDLMVSHNMITQAEADRAKNEPLVFAALQFPIEAPHYVSYVWSQIELLLGADILRSGGLVVTTTLDLDLQRSAESVLDRHLSRLQNPPSGVPSRNVHNGSIVTMDPIAGEVLVMVGSPDYFDSSIAGAVNTALAPRQPGSALKPFTYALALGGQAEWTAATVLLDVRTSFPTREGTPYVPLNYDRTFHGPVSVRQALAGSYNVPAVKALQSVGLDSLITLLRNLGLRTLEDADRYGLSLTLGGGEVRLLELTAAYGALANGGYRVEPVFIGAVTRNGAALPLRQRPASATRVMDARVAWLITDILSDDAARAPSFGRGSSLLLSRSAAVKTGTTTDWRDNWCIGYTPDLVTGVWVGNADNSPMVEVSGVTGAGPIWHDLMEIALLGRPVLQFPQPDGLVREEVCALSGKLPTPPSPHTGREWLIEGKVPTEFDDWYQTFEIDLTTGLIADPTTPPEQVVNRVYLVLPPELSTWARDNGISPPPSRAQGVAGGPGEDTSPLIITSPHPGVVYRISPAVPLSHQRIRLTAVARIPLTSVRFWLNGEPLSREMVPAFSTASSQSYEMFWALRPGKHQLLVTGHTTEGREVQSAPISFRVEETSQAAE
jgi:penicillin-binding protein 1C